MFLQRLRAVFEKCGRAKYISHLDLNRCMLRIFRRSKLPIWYTEGFNPHPYYSFALALSLGFESSCEIIDFNITDDNMTHEEIQNRLNEVMPEGMRIVSISEQVRKITAITKAEYSFSLVSEDSTEIYDAVMELLAEPEILVEKRTKKGVKTIDISGDVEIVSCELTSGSVDMVIRLPAGTQTNYNPMLFIDTLKKVSAVPFETAKIRRTGIFCGDGKRFH